MATYLLKRILLIIPTLFGIMLISFAVIQFAPGGPIERVIAQLSGTDVSATARIGGDRGDGIRYRNRDRVRRMPPNIAAPRASIRNLSSSWKSSSASTSLRTSASS